MKRIIFLIIGLAFILISCPPNLKWHSPMDLSLNNQSSFDVNFYSRQLEGVSHTTSGEVFDTM